MVPLASRDRIPTGLARYGGQVESSPPGTPLPTPPRRSGFAAILVYTGMRVGLFLAVWLLLQLVTPLRGLWAALVAILASGLISIFVLNRQRSAMSAVVGRFFGGINARIDAASRAEDDDEFDEGALQNWDNQAERQSDGVDRDELSRSDESGDESRSPGSAHDDSPRPPGPGEGNESQ